jgi:hypothetical protein
MQATLAGNSYGAIKRALTPLDYSQRYVLDDCGRKKRATTQVCSESHVRLLMEVGFKPFRSMRVGIVGFRMWPRKRKSSELIALRLSASKRNHERRLLSR